MTVNARAARRRYRIMIYGATGFTGSMVADAAAELDCDLVLAGRDRQRLARMSPPDAASTRAFTLEEQAQIIAALADIDLVLNIAGPFGATVTPLIEACLATGTHYLDVSGELSTFAAAHQHDAAARERGIMIMPGVGFTIVATDCLAAYAAAAFPGAKYLRFGVSQPDHLSRGSLRTIFAALRGQIVIRRSGRLTLVPAGRLEHQFDFGKGAQKAAAISLADVFTAYLTTGIPNIEAYVEVDYLTLAAGPITAHLVDALRPIPLQSLLQLGLAAWLQPSSGGVGAATRQVIVVELEDSWRRIRRVRMSTSDGYSFTASAAALIMRRIIDGDFTPGFQTPGLLYGPDLALAIPGTSRQHPDGADSAWTDPAARENHGGLC